MQAGRQRWRCQRGCGDTVWPGVARRRPAECLRLVADNRGIWRAEVGVEGYRLTQSPRRRRWRVSLGKGHEFANTGGWQWLARFLVADVLGYMPRTDEHAHHVDHDHRRLERTLDLTNLMLVLAEYHGRIHATHTDLAGGNTYQVPRRGAVIGWGIEQ